MVKVRFAPSPTGNLHIGGARTALFNWLYAQHTQGKFILRIEDTDKKRSKKKYLDEILNSLNWLRVSWDEIYYQSQRFALYKEYAQKLLTSGLANLEKKAIIFKMPKKIVRIFDLIHGEIQFDTSTIKNQVLIKSDATPTYNFACVIDDALMEITHVIRGDDHISNTPKQIVLYEALGFNLPAFAHVPLILGSEGGRLSKRTGATAISEYRQMGYLPEALINYLLLLGWSPGENQTIVSIDEAIKRFDIRDINKTAAIFDLDKLNWLNNQYLKKCEVDKIVDLVVPLFIQKRYIKRDFDRNKLKDLVKLLVSRVNTLENLVESSAFIFRKKIEIDKDAKKQHLKKDLSKEFSLYIQRLEKLNSFDHQAIEGDFREFASSLNLTARDLVHPLRVALTGKTVGPGLFELMSVLGKEKVIARLKQTIKEHWGRYAKT